MAAFAFLGSTAGGDIFGLGNGKRLPVRATVQENDAGMKEAVRMSNSVPHVHRKMCQEAIDGVHTNYAKRSEWYAIVKVRDKI